MKERDAKVCCFAGFCHHHLTTMSVHMHAYCYSYLFKSGMKTGLKTIALCRKDRVLTIKLTSNNNSKINFSYNDN